jgi:hypothetical protein
MDLFFCIVILKAKIGFDCNYIYNAMFKKRYDMICSYLALQLKGYFQSMCVFIVKDFCYWVQSLV